MARARGGGTVAARGRDARAGEGDARFARFDRVGRAVTARNWRRRFRRVWQDEVESMRARPPHVARADGPRRTRSGRPIAFELAFGLRRDPRERSAQRRGRGDAGGGLAAARHRGPGGAPARRSGGRRRVRPARDRLQDGPATTRSATWLWAAARCSSRCSTAWPSSICSAGAGWSESRPLLLHARRRVHRARRGAGPARRAGRGPEVLGLIDPRDRRRPSCRRRRARRRACGICDFPRRLRPPRGDPRQA